MHYHDPLFSTTLGFGVSTVAPAATPAAASKSATSDGSSGNALTGGDPASMRVITTDKFIFGGWINIPVDTPPGVIFTKGGVDDTTLEYGMLLITSAGEPYIAGQMHTGPGASDADATVQTAQGDFVYGTKTFLLCWFDGTNLNLKLNSATTTSSLAAMLTNPGAGEVVTLFSDEGAVSLNLSAKMDEWFFCKNPASMANALTTIGTSIYNSGTGVRYGSVSAGNKTTMGLVSWWGLDEASGSARLDLHGSNNLTLNGTITQTTPLVV